MIECRIKEAAKRRGLENPNQLAKAIAKAEGREMDAKDQVFAGRIWKAAQPSLASIDRALRGMPDCELSEVLVYKPRKSRAARNGDQKGRNGR